MSQILPGQRLRESDYEPVDEGLRRFITDLIFRPLAQIWREEVGKTLVYENSKDSDRKALLTALRSGRLQYSVDDNGRGVFSGQPSAALGRAMRAIGANFDSSARVYRLSPADVPAEVFAAGAAHAAACERAHQRMARFLEGVQGHVDQAVARLDPTALQGGTTIRRVAAGFDDAAGRISVNFEKMTPEKRARLSAAYTENMKLWIRKWASEDIVRLRRQIEANARSGARAQTLAARIFDRYKVAQSKARFLARQETGLYMAQYHKEQYTSAGVPRYVWYTSNDCDVRSGHKQLQGRVFTWAEGAPKKYMSSGKNCNPHEDYQCLPPTARIDLAHGIEKLFRRAYDGDMVTISTGDMAPFRATPNHPILTIHGWLPIGALHEGDQLVYLGEKGTFCEDDKEHGIPTISQAFEAFREAFPMLLANGHCEQFHGDGSDGDIDVVDATGLLRINGQASLLKRLGKFSFPESYFSHAGQGSPLMSHALSGIGHVSSTVMAGVSQCPAFLGSHARHAKYIRLGSSSDGDARSDQMAPDNISAYFQTKGNGHLALATQISATDCVGVKTHPAPFGSSRITMARRYYALLAKLTGDVVGTEADFLGDFFKKEPLRQEFFRTVKSVRRDRWVGHVYNLQTKHGWYISGNIIHRNCRCVARPLIDTAYNAKFRIGDTYVKESA